MIPFGEIVVFHLRSNGSIYLAHWLVGVYVALIAFWIIGLILAAGKR